MLEFCLWCKDAIFWKTILTQSWTWNPFGQYWEKFHLPCQTFSLLTEETSSPLKKGEKLRDFILERVLTILKASKSWKEKKGSIYIFSSFCYWKTWINIRNPHPHWPKNAELGPYWEQLGPLSLSLFFASRKARPSAARVISLMSAFW